jgi:hypothetical protein
MKDPNRLWWLKLVLIAASAVGMWYFEYALFPKNSGLLGAIVGLVLGACLAVIYEDYMDKRS